jgi:putative hydroxymethylpyrimidine transport system substrate-binding protein
VREVNLGFNLVPGLLSRKVDAVLGAFWNYEGVQLERERRRPQIIRMEEVGVPTYQELVLVAAEQTLNERGALVRRFLRALQDGTQAVREDPAAGVDPLLEANRELDRGLQTAVVRRTLPVFFPRDRERPFGWMEDEEWQAYATWMQRNGLLERQPTRQAFTNEFLPGEGVRPVEEEPGQQGDG